jgi:hypothetical protein
MIYFCCDERRRNEVRGGNDINGIDFLEVVDRDAPSDDLRQRLLRVHLLNVPQEDASIAADNIRIEGGERIRNIEVLDGGVTVGGEHPPNVVSVTVDHPGDFSVYTLRFVRSDSGQDTRPPENFDPMLASVEFSFKVECPSEFDCRAGRTCPPEVRSTPRIDYLAKDYASFRRLMLDRMAVLVPEWQERNAADLGIALVELLAYTGDHLSYEQDAVATEAYLGKARRRISVRRHARLVDYFISDGSNARTWVQIEVSSQFVLPAKTSLATRIPHQVTRITEEDRRLLEKAIVFETMHDIELFPNHGEMKLYTWSDERCCLPVGATRATLADHFPNLRADEGEDEDENVRHILVFEEVLGPDTGDSGDADRTHRHAVRLTEVRAFNESGDPLTDPVTNLPITEIAWSDEDALPFALCISSRVSEDDESIQIENVSVARGNIVLADHGRTIVEAQWEPVPEPRLYYAPKTASDRCKPPDPKLIPIRFYPRLKEKHVTQAAEPKPVLLKSARAAMQWEQHQVLPEIRLMSDQAGEGDWEPKRDLLNSSDDGEHFVAEIESDGSAFLRFGDDDHGKRPNAGTRFTPEYRVGNGVVGNIGVDSLKHILSDNDAIIKVRNLTPGQGGAEPESIENVRQRAPYAFRTQERAVTQNDYETVTERHPDVQRVAATARWTGSWHTWFLTVDRKGGLDVDQEFKTEIRNHVERFRVAGYDLEVDGPLFVPLEIEMFVCVKPEHFRSDVKEALLKIFSNQRLADGRLGVFHPDNFTFGQTVYLSPLYARAQAVPGVASVEFKTFQRQREPDPKPLNTGKIPMDRLEIARLDNDRNFPERGVFRLEMGGGK